MDNDWRVRVAVMAVRAYCQREGNAIGGSLRIVLDGRSVGDAHVDWCIQWARENGDKDGEALGLMLRGMSRSQRDRVARSMYRKVAP